MKYKKFCYFSLWVIMLGSASSTSATTYRLQRVTSVEDGGMYVFEQAGYVMKNAISSSALQTTSSFKTTGLDLTSAGDKAYVWELSSVSGGFKIYKYNASGDKYLANPSGTTLSLVASSSASVWSFTFQPDGTTNITTGSGSSMQTLAFSSPSLASYNYKCYPSGELGYQPHSIVVYKLVEEAEGKQRPGLNYGNKFEKLVKESSFTSHSLSKAEAFKGSIAYSSSNTDVATVDESGDVSIVGSGHALITASSEADDDYDAGEATYTIVVMDGDGTESKPFSAADFSSGFLGSSSASAWAQGYIVGGYENVGSIGELVETATSDKYISIADAIEGASTSNIFPAEYANFGLSSHPELKNCKVLLYGKIGIIMNKTALTNVSSASKLTYGVTISNYKYATYRTTEKLDFTNTEVAAYSAAINGDNVVLTRIGDGIVDTGLGVVLYSETAGTYDIPVTTATATVTSTGLSISDGTTATKEANIYVLGKKNDSVGFYRWVGTQSLSAGRVYLNGSTSAARDYLEFMFDEPTGISDVMRLDNKEEIINDACYYTVNGVRLSGKPTARGLYIVNGKKVIIK